MQSDILKIYSFRTRSDFTFSLNYCSYVHMNQLLFAQFLNNTQICHGEHIFINPPAPQIPQLIPPCLPPLTLYCRGGKYTGGIMNDTKGHACRVCRRRGVVGDTGFPSTIYCRKVSEIIKYSRGTYMFRKLLLMKYTVLKK